MDVDTVIIGTAVGPWITHHTPEHQLFRNGLNFLIVATFINFVIVGTASYRGVAYVDQPSFCTACHNLLAVDEANPKQLADLGLQRTLNFTAE